MDNYFCKDFRPIIEYCKTATVFQDVPFSKPTTYEILYKIFPNAKFILTIRDSSEIWYNSLVMFHNKLFYKNRKVTADLVKNVSYIKKGWIYSIIKNTNKTPDDDLYNKKILIDFYENYNKNVIKYFKDKPEKLIIINLSNKDDFNRILDFLNIKKTHVINGFLHLNKT